MESESSALKRLVVQSRLSAVDRICRQLLAEAAGSGFDDEDTFAIHLALEEAFTNAVKHGNNEEPSKTVGIEYLVTAEKFEIYVSDQGSGFEPDSVPDPRQNENLCKPCGRGLLLINSYMDLVEHNENGNCVHMIKYRTQKE